MAPVGDTVLTVVLGTAVADGNGIVNTTVPVPVGTVADDYIFGCNGPNPDGGITTALSGPTAVADSGLYAWADPGASPAGSSVDICAEGFPDGDILAVAFSGTVLPGDDGHLTADYNDDGYVCQPVTVPADASMGDHIFELTSGVDPSRYADAAFVVTGLLDHLVLSPADATILNPESGPAPDPYSYAAEGYDADGNDLGDVTADTTFAINGAGSCTGPICGSATPGTYTITGTDDAASGTTSLTVMAWTAQDTDGDGFANGVELAAGTNLLDPTDYPGSATVCTLGDATVVAPTQEVTDNLYGFNYSPSIPQVSTSSDGLSIESPYGASVGYNDSIAPVVIKYTTAAPINGPINSKTNILFYLQPPTDLGVDVPGQSSSNTLNFGTYNSRGGGLGGNILETSYSYNNVTQNVSMHVGGSAGAGAAIPGAPIGTPVWVRVTISNNGPTTLSVWLDGQASHPTSRTNYYYDTWPMTGIQFWVEAWHIVADDGWPGSHVAPWDGGHTWTISNLRVTTVGGC
jgi:hypothetical protein